MSIENKIVKNTVVLVDDNTIDNFINTKIITRYQFADNILSFEKSIDALKYLLDLNTAPENEIPGLLFLDLDMPEIDGFEFLNAFNLVSEKVKNNMKIVILSSSSSLVDIEKCNKFDSVIAYFQKPLIKDNLDTLEKLLSASKSTLIF